MAYCLYHTKKKKFCLYCRFNSNNGLLSFSKKLWCFYQRWFPKLEKSLEKIQLP